MDFSTFIITYYKYIISAAVSAVFLVVNIIQFFRTRNKNKLKEAICRIPEIIREVEVLVQNIPEMNLDDSSPYYTTTTRYKSMYKKATAESLLKNEFGEKFVNKYIGVLDECIEDVLNTPSKKGGTYVQKEDEKR